MPWLLVTAVTKTAPPGQVPDGPTMVGAVKATVVAGMTLAY